jgi:hypothetical protein
MAITFILSECPHCDPTHEEAYLDSSAFTALGTKSFGYDQTWGYCWYSTENVSTSLVLTRILLTYSIPTLLGIIYLILAAITISFSVFGSHSRLNRFAGSRSTFNMESGNNEVGARHERESTGHPNSPDYGRSFSLEKDGLSSGPRSSTSPIFSQNKASYESHSFPPIPSSAIFQHSNHQRHLLTTLLERTADEAKEDRPIERAMPYDGQPPSGESNLTVEIQPNEQVRMGRKRQRNARKDAVMRQLTFRLIGAFIHEI